VILPPSAMPLPAAGGAAGEAAVAATAAGEEEEIYVNICLYLFGMMIPVMDPMVSASRAPRQVTATALLYVEPEPLVLAALQEAPVGWTGGMGHGLGRRRVALWPPEEPWDVRRPEEVLRCRRWSCEGRWRPAPRPSSWPPRELGVREEVCRQECSGKQVASKTCFPNGSLRRPRKPRLMAWMPSAGARMLLLLLALVTCNGPASARTLPPARRVGEALRPGPRAGQTLMRSRGSNLDDSDAEPRFPSSDDEHWDGDQPVPGEAAWPLPPPVAGAAGSPREPRSDDQESAASSAATSEDDESGADAAGHDPASGTWSAAERRAGIVVATGRRHAPATRTEANAPSSATHTPFHGPVPGKVYTTRGGSTGYHEDAATAPTTRTTLCLQELLQPPLPVDTGVFEAQPAARHRRTPDGRRVRPRRRRAPTSPPPNGPLVVPAHCDLQDCDWREHGIWAIDSSNANSWESAKMHVLARSAADVVLLQEVRMTGAAGIATIKRSGRSIGWSCAASPAEPSESGPASGGCAVAARRGIGVADELCAQVPAAIRHRFHISTVGAILRGGLHLGAVYLKDGVGIDDANLDTLQHIAGVLRQVRGPWVLGGDWNVAPAALLATGWLELVGGVIITQDSPTCGSNVYDYFVVKQGFAAAVAGIQRVDDAGLNPHWPCRLLIRGDARSCRVRQLVRPLPVPGVLPHGPLPDPGQTRQLWPTVDESEIEQAAGSWMAAARQEWASLLGTQPALQPPRFRWQPAAGPLAAEFAGATAETVLWRNLASRLVECAAILERFLPDRAALLRRHLVRAWLAVRDAPLDEERRGEVRRWVDAAATLLRFGKTIEVRRLAAVGRATAAKLEAKRRHALQVRWKNDLVVRSSDAPGPARPSRMAYRWLRGAAGWQRSPLGPTWMNDEAEQERLDVASDDCPAHLVEPSGRPSRLWRPQEQNTATVLCDQADVEREADDWARIWDEGAAYDTHFDDPVCRDLVPLRVWAVQHSAASFPVGTGRGSDNIAPRAFGRLSTDLLTALCVLLMAAELRGGWPAVVDFVMIMLLPKSDGGRRPIGLFPALPRIWARARSVAAQAWESQHSRPYIFGGAGRGAQRAAWLSGFRAEAAALAGTSFAQSLLDLVKAFETIPHRHLVEAARRHGFPLWLLRMSLAAYRLPRTIGVDGCFSRLIVAARGITAGSCFATSELRLLLLDVVDSAYKRYLTIDLTLYVDDLTIACSGPAEVVVATVALATDHVVRLLEGALGLTVSVKKSVVAACRSSLAVRVKNASRTRRLSAVRATKLLGAPAGGGRRRYVAPAMTRVKAFIGKIRKIRVMRKAGVAARSLITTAGNPAALYGTDIMGISDTHLSTLRSAVAAALSRSTAGRSPDLVLYAADASGGRVDPAFEAHEAPMKAWCYAWWQGWQPRRLLAEAFVQAAAKLKGATRSPWDVAAGPAAALIATLWRLGWLILGPSTFVSCSGMEVDIAVDPPAAVVALVRADVRRWQLAQVLGALPGARPDRRDFGDPAAVATTRPGPPCFAPESRLISPLYASRMPQSVFGMTAAIGKLLDGPGRAKGRPSGWLMDHKPFLRSAVCGGQWPQVRIAGLAGEGADDQCQLCHDQLGTLEHRRSCQATMPDGGWPAPKRHVQHFLGKISDLRRRILQTRGILLLDVVIPRPVADGWCEWLLPVPDPTDPDLTYYIDGSLVDGPSKTTSRAGFAVVVVDAAGRLVGYAAGAPPAWATSSAAAEAWAMLVVLQTAAAPPKVVTDCLGLLETLQRGREAATAANRPLARLWALTFAALDGQPPEGYVHGPLCWMASHGSRGTVGIATLSDGRAVTFTDWRANRLADGLAKQAAVRDRVPAGLRRFLATAEEATCHEAAVLGMVTHAAANHWVSSTKPDGTYTVTRSRDACPPPFENTKGRAARRGTGGKQAEQDAPPKDPCKAQDTHPQLAQRGNEDAGTAADWHRARAQRAKQAREEKEDAAEARFHEGWAEARLRADRPPPAAGPTATERVEAIRLRLAAKAAAAVVRPPPADRLPLGPAWDEPAWD
jgi:hypothetical protein